MAFTQGGCTQHHLVWYDGFPVVKIGCAHCSYVKQHLDLGNTTPPDLIRDLIESSRAGHERLCHSQRTRKPRRQA